MHIIFSSDPYQKPYWRIFNWVCSPNCPTVCSLLAAGKFFLSHGLIYDFRDNIWELFIFHQFYRKTVINIDCNNATAFVLQTNCQQAPPFCWWSARWIVMHCCRIGLCFFCINVCSRHNSFFLSIEKYSVKRAARKIVFVQLETNCV